jgi:aminoglycoside 2'-N-acetyltransferase I
MNNRIKIVNGDEGREPASRLLRVVWPPEIVASLPWRDVVWARADSRVLSINGHNDIIGHAGMVLRSVTLGTQPVKIGGVGGVATHPDCRGQGVASEVMRQAVSQMRDTHCVDFGLLFCEQRHAPLYKRLGWHFFEGPVFVEQPRQGRVHFSVTDPYVFDLKIAPRAGILDLCGLPW